MDLQIRRGPGRPYPEIKGGSVSKKNFSALWASVWCKNKGGGGGQGSPGPSPGSATAEEKITWSSCLADFSNQDFFSINILIAEAYYIFTCLATDMSLALGMHVFL